MHFRIARTFMKYVGFNDESVFVSSLHICEAAPLIRKMVTRRADYRKLLVHAAQMALASGARATALRYLDTALVLLQDNPWDEDSPDVEYNETLNLHVQVSQLHWHQGDNEQAQRVLGSIFVNVSSAKDKATPWIIQSRIFMRRGHTEAAFSALRTSLTELGLYLDVTPTWESCDKQYHVVRAKLRSMNHDSRKRRQWRRSSDENPTGVVLVEAISAAFWTDRVTFYQMVLKAAELYLQDFEAYSHIGLGLAYFALVSRHMLNRLVLQLNLCLGSYHKVRRLGFH